MGAFSRRGREEGHVVGTRGKRANTRGCRDTSAFTRCSIEFRPGAARFSLYLFCSSTR